MLMGENASPDCCRYFETSLKFLVTCTEKYFMILTEFVPTCSMNIQYYFCCPHNGPLWQGNHLQVCSCLKFIIKKGPQRGTGGIKLKADYEEASPYTAMLATQVLCSLENYDL